MLYSSGGHFFKFTLLYLFGEAARHFFIGSDKVAAFSFTSRFPSFARLFHVDPSDPRSVAATIDNSQVRYALQGSL